jgi:hypothetical protein
MAFLGEEGHPILIAVPQMTIVKDAGESNNAQWKVAETIFCNVVNVPNKQALFKRFVHDLADARRNGEEDITRDFGDVRATLDMLPQSTESYVDVTLSLRRKPG